MSRRNGSPYPLPPGMVPIQQPQPQAMVLAQPINDVQVVAIIGAILLPHNQAPAEATQAEKLNAVVDTAIELLAHAQFKQARGVMGGAITDAKRQGEALLAEQVKAEEAKARGEGEPPPASGSGIVVVP